MIRRAIVTWVLMVPIAILNGGLRESLVEPQVGERAANQISVVTGSLAFFTLIYVMLRRNAPAKTDRWLLGLGGAWVAATVVFEFVFGHLVMGKAWSYLLADYNVLEGRLWPVVLVVVGIAPLAVKRIANTRHDLGDPVGGHHAAAS
ncbi:MAG TPA: hypothetical protein VD789_08875 [Thermomicrobiales bacterium]|nr:hypothetical protein [Thermomicrobiales bacterium]